MQDENKLFHNFFRINDKLRNFQLHILFIKKWWDKKRKIIKCQETCSLNYDKSRAILLHLIKLNCLLEK